MIGKLPQRVISIKGSREAGVLRDADFQSISELQALPWQAERAVHGAVANIETRILHGATVRVKRFYFDAQAPHDAEPEGRECGRIGG